MTTAVMAGVSLVAAGEPDDVDVEAVIARLDLRQRIGQMMTMGYEGRRLTPEMSALINDDGIGGFFFQPLNNYNFPDELAKLVCELQDAALEGAAGVPLFVALDQEGGAAAPLHYMLGATPTPGNMALGASGREEDAYNAYRALGNDMRACGANVDYAPAIDVLTKPRNPDYTVRVFGGDMARNAVMARGAVRGLQDEGVVACAKHFPGLAYFEEDTHDAAPRIALTNEDLWKGDMAHFRAAIEAGADMIMTGHVYLTAWDPDYPATLSRKVLTGVLREKLGYEGLIISDSMGMGGVADSFGRAESTVLAVMAGCDIILQVSRNTAELHERIDAVIEAVGDGRIPEDRINASVRRILSAKAEYNLFTKAKPDADKVYEKMATPELVEANKRAALNGIVVVRDDAELLPLPKTGKQICVICPPSALTRAGKGGEALPVGYTLGRAVRAIVPDAAEARVDTVPSHPETAYALKKAQNADIIIAASLLAMQSSGQADFINSILALGKPTVVVGLGDPSDMSLFPEVTTFIAANSPVPICTEAAAKVLFGEAEPGGTLPMPIGDLYPINHSITQ